MANLSVQPFAPDTHLKFSFFSRFFRYLRLIRSYRCKVLMNRRLFTDSIVWLVFFICTLVFCFLYLWFGFKAGNGYEEFQYTNFAEFIFRKEIVEPGLTHYVNVLLLLMKDSVLYTLIMMMPVYLNLTVLKPYTLDTELPAPWNYMLYLVLTIVVAALFASGFLMINGTDFSPFRTTIDFPVHLLTIAGVQLVSVGLLYRREILGLHRKLRRLEKIKSNLRKEVQEIKREQQQEMSKLQQNLRVGSRKNYQIIPIDNILYLKAAGNEPFIYTNDKKGKYCGDRKLSDYEELLPSYGFIRVHRSYIVAKHKVIGRKGEMLLLKGVEDPIPIGKKYEQDVLDDPWIGFGN